MGVKVDCSELKEFAKKIEQLNGIQRDQFFQAATQAMAGRLLALVIPRTPVGTGTKDADGRTVSQGGTLRLGWTGGVEGADGMAYAMTLGVQRTGSGFYSITITNPVYYASYVEYGHRQTPGRYVPAIGKRLKASWVNGQFFLRTSEEQLKAIAPTILQPMLDTFLRTVF